MYPEYLEFLESGDYIPSKQLAKDWLEELVKRGVLIKEPYGHLVTLHFNKKGYPQYYQLIRPRRGRCWISYIIRMVYVEGELVQETEENSLTFMPFSIKYEIVNGDTLIIPGAEFFYMPDYGKNWGLRYINFVDPEAKK